MEAISKISTNIKDLETRVRLQFISASHEDLCKEVVDKGKAQQYHEQEDKRSSRI